MNPFVQAARAIRRRLPVGATGFRVGQAWSPRRCRRVTSTRFVASLAVALAGAFGMAASTPAFAIDYRIVFDTSSIAGSSGSVDFQWNLGALDPSLIATVSSFSGAVLSEPTTLLTGDVNGSLGSGGGLQFGGSAPINIAYQMLDFGTSVGFTLQLVDHAPEQSVNAFLSTLDATSFSSAFVVSVLNEKLYPALPTLPSTINGASLIFSLAPGEGPVLSQYTAASVNVLTPVPEPETYALFLSGLMALGFVYRRSQPRR